MHAGGRPGLREGMLHQHRCLVPQSKVATHAGGGKWDGVLSEGHGGHREEIVPVTIRDNLSIKTKD